MKEARSEHIHNTASAISAGLPKRPTGWRPTTDLQTAGAPKRRSPIGVSITPGHTALIRIPLLAFSSAAVFVNPITPCLLALYAPAPTDPIKPVTDAMFTMAPPP